MRGPQRPQVWSHSVSSATVPDRPDGLTPRPGRDRTDECRQLSGDLLCGLIEQPGRANALLTRRADGGGQRWT